MVQVTEVQWMGGTAGEMPAGASAGAAHGRYSEQYKLGKRCQ